ncbi:MAG: terminase small subunit [Oscillospiraceae bacterium]
MGRPKKYSSANTFSKAIEKYFSSISRTVTLTEKLANGKYTQKGEPMFDIVNICNDEGEPIRVREFVVPPSVSALCLYLKISKDTWGAYLNDAELSSAAENARARIEAFLEGELISRVKGVHGVEFNLMQNFGWKDRVSVSGGNVEDYLRKLPESKDEF